MPAIFLFLFLFQEATRPSRLAQFYEDYLNIPGFEFWKFLNLAVFIVIIYYVAVYFKLPDAFKAKRDAIRADLIRAEEEKKAALARLTAIEARLAQLESEKESINIFEVPQLINSGEVAQEKMLPSFLYLPSEYDFPEGSTALPWERDKNVIVGELARKRGAENPARFVASAKSWLCHSKVNRTLPILPWQAPAR